ncbi:MAG: alpha amylase N-terminal ig-like domain-containing protein [Ruminococcus sp.]|nr:alpha amylase N-terminal ig-like domain-containing protein [Ruminococcus sp.]
MNLAAIRHRSTGSDCYALDSDTVVLNLWTDHSVKAVSVVSEDPFIHELHRRRAWEGKPTPMRRLYELAHQVVWTAELKPAYKRLQYYFVVEGEGKRFGVFENKICPMEERDRISTEYFKFPWINPSDVIAPPDWVRDTVWYQIMPDRFARSSNAPSDPKFRRWGDFSSPHFGDLYGGNLRGIRERLPYLRQLGVSGIYLTPIFLSNSNHKYNTFDYYKVDPDFGSEQDLCALVQNAHALGMRIMLDAVFNHCGTEFFAWKDVCEKGRASRYFDWFFINRDDFVKDDFSVADGRFYTFSFWAGMPKLNTNNPEVQRYFTDLCVHWVGDLGIDGIRFDVGDEISHSFLRRVNAAVKAAKPETFLLGEIWFDAIGWLGGCEYDSVMNYPFTGAVGDFWRDREMTARDFMHRLNFCRSLYPRQINEALFSFLDTHDTARVRESCRNQNEMLQKLAILLTMAGTPCLYYGTEIAMKGAHTPYNRSTMPWDEIDAGKFDRFKSKVSALVRVRSEQPDLRRDEMDFFFDESLPRLVGYRKGAVTVLLNAGDTPAPVAAAQEILFSNGYKNGTLLPDGVLLCK